MMMMMMMMMIFIIFINVCASSPSYEEYGGIRPNPESGLNSAEYAARIATIGHITWVALWMFVTSIPDSQDFHTGSGYVVGPFHATPPYSMVVEVELINGGQKPSMLGKNLKQRCRQMLIYMSKRYKQSPKKKVKMDAFRTAANKVEKSMKKAQTVRRKTRLSLKFDAKEMQRDLPLDNVMDVGSHRLIIPYFQYDGIVVDYGGVRLRYLLLHGSKNTG